MEIGAGLALAEGGPLHVLNLSELPEQTLLDADVADSSRLDSLERRLGAMAEERGIDINLDSINTHDIFSTLRSFGKDEHCDWLLLGWKPVQQIGFIIKNKGGWLYSGLECNVARYKDVGARYIRKILVYPEPDYYAPLLVATSERLAKMFNSQLTFVSVVPINSSPQDIELVENRLEELASQCTCPADTLVVEARESEVAIRELTPWYDLLLLPAPRPRTLTETIRGTAVDRLIEVSACSVLSLTRKSTGEESKHKNSSKKKAMA